MVVLAAFIPMLMDTGGNSGSQASAVVIRSLVLGEITFNDILRVIWKEIRVSFLVGITLSTVSFLRIYFLEGNTIAVSAAVSVTLLFTVIIAKVTGGILPILAKKLKLDPAIIASPLITTIVDALALTVYFYCANLFIGIQS